MNVESAESNTEITGDARNVSDVDSSENLELNNAGKVINYQDVQASLAIINGYNNALRSSFDELKNQYGDILEQKDGESETTGSVRLISLEVDCRLCLSRLCSSVDQLKQRLEVAGVLRASTPD